jgi:hypothetical protein
MVDQDIEEFVGLCASVLDDGEITEERAYQLGDWLNQHEEAAEHWPCNQLIEPLQAVWVDGAANPQELQRLARVLIRLQEEWALRKGAMATYYKSMGPPAVYSYVPKVNAPAAPALPRAAVRPGAAAPPREGRSRWVLAAGSITILLAVAGVFAAREMRSAHEKPGNVSSSPIVTATPVPSAPTSLAPPRSVPIQAPAKPATPSAAWTAITRQNVKAKAGKKEIVIPKGTTVKVIARSTSDLMISYKGESLTIPASATTSSR